MDDEQARLAILLATKRDVLSRYDVQAEQMGPLTPPHINMERARLRRELGMTETVLSAPAGLNISEELGEGGRFVYYAEQFRQVRQEMREIAIRHEERLTAFVQESLVWRMRQGVILVVIVVVVVALALIVVFWLGRLSDSRALMSWFASLRR